MIDKNKENDIREFINVYALDKDQLEEVITPFVNAALEGRKSNDSLNEIKDITIQQILKNDFVTKYIQSFDDEFTHTEIKFLLDFYKSDTMKKFLKTKNLFMPMFQEFNSIIMEIIDKREKSKKIIKNAADLLV